jgi:serine/threonine protein kinase
VLRLRQQGYKWKQVRRNLRSTRTHEITLQSSAINSIVIVICGIVRGLVSLHSCHLFHSYLKPTDIILDSDQNVHVTDCILFSLERFRLAFSSLVGSPIYTAPEQYTMEN